MSKPTRRRRRAPSSIPVRQVDVTRELRELRKRVLRDAIRQALGLESPA